MTVYAAKAEDLTHLGGPMGSEYTTTSSLGLFTTASKAMACCAEHYRRTRPEGILHFYKYSKTEQRTKDLGHVMYHVVALAVK
jgi:hypothetical protein